MKALILTLCTITGGIIGWFLGGLDGFLYALIAFVVADYITGVLAAITEKKLSSAVGFRGIFRKILIFLLVGLANLLDIYILGEAGVLRMATIFFYISNEGISLIENAARLGLPVPGPLVRALSAIRDTAEDTPAGGTSDLHFIDLDTDPHTDDGQGENHDVDPPDEHQSK